MLHRGFPPALVELKHAIAEAAPGLKAENPGSRWPKTSLGALGDSARLTPDQLDRLNAICRCGFKLLPAGRWLLVVQRMVILCR